MKFTYGILYKLPESIKQKERRLLINLIKEMKSHGHKGLFLPVKNTVRCYNHMNSFLIYQTSFIFLKTNLSKNICNITL